MVKRVGKIDDQPFELRSFKIPLKEPDNSVSRVLDTRKNNSF